MTAISVVIPVFNVEPYIGACIESLKQQSFRDIEFIFVDNCSTDDSMVYVEEFAKSDARVRILCCTEKSGSGPVKNLGIEAAKGEYISIVDSDDRIAPDFYERLYAKACSGDYDIIKGTRIRVDLKSGDSYTEKMNEKIRQGLDLGIPLFVLFTWQHQTAIYKNSLFEDKRVRFGRSRNSQDLTFLLIACKKARNIIFEDDAVYFISARPGSQTTIFTAQRCQYELDSIKERIDFLLSEKMDAFDYQYLVNSLTWHISSICRVISEGSISYEQEAELVNFLRQQIMRIPDPNQIKTAKLELMILMDYQKLIPVSNLRPNAFHYDRVRRWVDFLSAHPEIKEKRIWTGFDFALVDVIFPKKKTSGKSYFFGRRYFGFMRKQIGRLTGRQRSLMLRYSSPALKRAMKNIYQLIRSGEK